MHQACRCAHLRARAPTTIRPAVLAPVSAPRVVTLRHSRRGRALGSTALRARPQTDVHFAWSSAVPNPTRTTSSPRSARAATNVFAASRRYDLCEAQWVTF